MLSANTLRFLARHGLSGLVSEAKRAGGDAFAARTAERLLAMICDAAVRELGCTRARELIIDEVTPSDLPEGGAIGRLERGQRVDIGAHPDGSRAVSDTQCSHDADAAETAAHLEPGLFQNRRHNFASPHLLESKLGMRVKIPPQLGEERQIGRDLF